jgi:DNA-binding beta-propeller fold protein YncE
MRLLILLAITVLAGIVQAQPAPRVYVSVEDANTVVVLDPSSLRIVTRVRVGFSPHNLTALGQGLIVVANWGSRFISVLDPANLRHSVDLRPRATPRRRRLLRRDARLRR